MLRSAAPRIGLAMKLASWNVNSIRVRLPQLLGWLESASPDVVCLQETKVVDALFPVRELEAAGYRAAFSGQPTYNGVAILAKQPIENVVVGLPGDDDASQRRLVAADVGGVRVVNAYVPNGSEVGSEKYAYKMDWLERLTLALAERQDPSRPLVLCGDFNVAPEDRDVYDADANRGMIMFSAEERAAIARILAWGLADTLRLHVADGGHFSWWDYRMGAFRRNLGWRIDLILATAPLARACASASIDPAPRRLEKPSDHAPVIATFEGA